MYSVAGVYVQAVKQLVGLHAAGEVVERRDRKPLIAKKIVKEITVIAFVTAGVSESIAYCLHLNKQQTLKLNTQCYRLPPCTSKSRKNTTAGVQKRGDVFIGCDTDQVPQWLLFITPFASHSFHWLLLSTNTPLISTLTKSIRQLFSNHPRHMTRFTTITTQFKQYSPDTSFSIFLIQTNRRWMPVCSIGPQWGIQHTAIQEIMFTEIERIARRE